MPPCMTGTFPAPEEAPPAAPPGKLDGVCKLASLLTVKLHWVFYWSAPPPQGLFGACEETESRDHNYVVASPNCGEGSHRWGNLIRATMMHARKEGPGNKQAGTKTPDLERKDNLIRATMMHARKEGPGNKQAGTNTPDLERKRTLLITYTDQGDRHSQLNRITVDVDLNGEPLGVSFDHHLVILGCRPGYQLHRDGRLSRGDRLLQAGLFPVRCPVGLKQILEYYKDNDHLPAITLTFEVQTAWEHGAAALAGVRKALARSKATRAPVTQNTVFQGWKKGNF